MEQKIKNNIEYNCNFHKISNYKKRSEQNYSNLSMNEKSFMKRSNNNKPIKINYINKNFSCYNNGINFSICNDEEEKNDNYYKKLINNMKKDFGFKGNIDDFIEYMQIQNAKSDITLLVEKIFNVDKNQPNNTKKCYKNLENVINNIDNENEDLLDIYQYLTEQLLKVNNLNHIDI